MRLRWLRCLPFLTAAVLTACDDDPAAVRVPPRLDSALVSANPNMTIAAAVTIYGEGDSAAVRFRAPGESGDSTTPAFFLEDGQVRVPVLGLLPSNTYALRAVLWRDGDSVSRNLEFTTGALPPDLPSYTAGGPSPLPGYVVFAAGAYGLVINNAGRVVWYRKIEPNGPGLNFMAQPTGVYTVRPASSTLAAPGRWIEFDAEGFPVRDFGCLNGFTARFHDLVVEPDGSYWIMCDETRTMDLSSVGGVAGAQVTGTVIQHISGSGTLLLHWSPFDHFQITDLEASSRTGSSVNWTHGNSLAVDTDGNILASFRSLHEITKINATTGQVIWRMGGLANQFTFSGSGAPGFQAQHNVRVVGPNRFIILDNTGSADSRYERYVLDPSSRHATLESWYTASTPVQTAIGGSVQRAGAGRWLASFGTMGRVEEFDDSGALHWQINGNPGYVFRAQRIHSLYNPGAGSER